MNTDAMHILVDVINQAAHPLQEHNESYTHLIDKIGEARFVLIGEASHGTHEFYQTRIEITKTIDRTKRFYGGCDRRRLAGCTSHTPLCTRTCT